MKTLAFNATGDLDFPIRLADGTEAVLQKIRARLRFFLGEWFLDRRLGVPYYTKILVKNPNLALVSSIFRRVIRGTPGVHSVKYVRVRLDNKARIAYVSFEARTSEGAQMRISDEPFIVTD